MSVIYISSLYVTYCLLLTDILLVLDQLINYYFQFLFHWPFLPSQPLSEGEGIVTLGVTLCVCVIIIIIIVIIFFNELLTKRSSEHISMCVSAKP